MIDATHVENFNHEYVEELFLHLVKTGQFVDKKADVRLSPRCYLTATYLCCVAVNPLRAVFGDYEIRLHL